MVFHLAVGVLLDRREELVSLGVLILKLQLVVDRRAAVVLRALVAVVPS